MSKYRVGINFAVLALLTLNLSPNVHAAQNCLDLLQTISIRWSSLDLGLCIQ